MKARRLYSSSEVLTDRFISNRRPFDLKVFTFKQTTERNNFVLKFSSTRSRIRLKNHSYQVLKLHKKQNSTLIVLIN